jgi:hypothetical protein
MNAAASLPLGVEVLRSRPRSLLALAAGGVAIGLGHALAQAQPFFEVLELTIFATAGLLAQFPALRALRGGGSLGASLPRRPFAALLVDLATSQAVMWTCAFVTAAVIEPGSLSGTDPHAAGVLLAGAFATMSMGLWLGILSAAGAPAVGVLSVLGAAYLPAGLPGFAPYAVGYSMLLFAVSAGVAAWQVRTPRGRRTGTASIAALPEGSESRRPAGPWEPSWSRVALGLVQVLRDQPRWVKVVAALFLLFIAFVPRSVQGGLAICVFIGANVLAGRSVAGLVPQRAPGTRLTGPPILAGYGAALPWTPGQMVDLAMRHATLVALAMVPAVVWMHWAESPTLGLDRSSSVILLLTASPAVTWGEALTLGVGRSARRWRDSVYLVPLLPGAVLSMVPGGNTDWSRALADMLPWPSDAWVAPWEASAALIALGVLIHLVAHVALARELSRLSPAALALRAARSTRSLG